MAHNLLQCLLAASADAFDSIYASFVLVPFNAVCCMCRLVRALLGEDAIAERKLEAGNPLTVLGVQVQTNLGGVAFTPDAAKVKAWVYDIERTLFDERLPAGEASKLAGGHLVKQCVSPLSVLVCGALCRAIGFRLAVCLQTAGASATGADLPSSDEQVERHRGGTPNGAEVVAADIAAWHVRGN